MIESILTTMGNNAMFKSVQRFFYTDIAASKSQTISEVDLSKSFILLHGSLVSLDNRKSIMAKFTSSTSVMLEKFDTVAVSNLSMEVIELSAGFSVQSGVSSIVNSSSVSIPISQIDPQKSMVVLSCKCNSTASSISFVNVATQSISSNELVIKRTTNSSVETFISWFLITSK